MASPANELADGASPGRAGSVSATHPPRWRRGPAIIAAVIAVLLCIRACGSGEEGGRDAAPGPSRTVTATETAEPATETVTLTAEPVTVTAQPDAAADRDTGDRSDAGEPAATGDAASALAALPVKGRAPKTGYERGRFGQRWADVDRNGCDTRNDILGRDLADVVRKPGTHGCVVLSGTLDDPYTGKAIAFRRGEDTSRAVQIDHVVAMSNAWQTGAQQLDTATRTAFANDPLNLLAVDGPANQRKGAGDAATWLPPERGFRCSYVARQVAVKAKYRLWVTPPEREAIARILSGCPGEPLPADGL